MSLRGFRTLIKQSHRICTSKGRDVNIVDPQQFPTKADVKLELAVGCVPVDGGSEADVMKSRRRSGWRRR